MEKQNGVNITTLYLLAYSSRNRLSQVTQRPNLPDFTEYYPSGCCWWTDQDASVLLLISLRATLGVGVNSQWRVERSDQSGSTLPSVYNVNRVSIRGCSKFRALELEA